MEGDLQYYKGNGIIFTGVYKKVYAIIDGSDFVAYKGTQKAQDFKEVLRL